MADVVRNGNSRAHTDRLDDAWRTVTITGDLDMATVEEMLTAVHGAAGHAPCIVLELREVPFCDVVGLGGILRAQEALGAAGQQLRIANPPPSLRRILDALALHPVELFRLDQQAAAG